MNTGVLLTARPRRAAIRRIVGIGLLLGVLLLAGCESNAPATPVTKQAGTTVTTRATTSTTSHPPTTTTTEASTT
jgi:hypothetical protein